MLESTEENPNNYVLPMQDDDITPFIKEIISSTDEDSKLNKINAVKGVATLLAIVSSAPFIKPAMDAAGPYTVLGYFFAGGTLICFGAGTTWVFYQVIDSCKSKSDAEKRLKTETTCLRIGKTIFVHGISLLLSIIPFYTAYKYNGITWVTFVSLPVSYVFNVFGYSKLINTLLNRNIKKYFTKQDGISINVEKGKRQFTFYIKDKVIPNLLAQDSNKIVMLHDQWCKEFDSDTLIRSICSTEITVNYKLPNEYYGGWPQRITQGLFLIFPGATTIVNGTLAHEATKLIISIEWLSYFIPVLLTLPAVGIDTFVTLSTAGAIFCSIFNRVHKNPNTNLFSRKFPCLNVSLIVLLVGLAALSTSSKGYIAYTTVEESLKIFLTTTAVVNSLIFETFALTELFQKLVNYLIKKYGSIDEKYLLSMQHGLLEIADVVEQVDTQQYRGFFEKHTQVLNNISTFDETTIILLKKEESDQNREQNLSIDESFSNKKSKNFSFTFFQCCKDKHQEYDEQDDEDRLVTKSSQKKSACTIL